MTFALAADSRILTRPHTPAPGCALDPLDEEASWVAWRVVSASPNQVTSEGAVLAASSVFDRILEMSRMPGRVSALSEVATVFEDGYPRLEISFALAVLGPVGSTVDEASTLAELTERRLHSNGLPYRFAPIDPALILDLSDDDVANAALIRQRMVTIETDAPRGDFEVLSRWNPISAPWNFIASALLTRPTSTRVRATVLPTEVTITDRIQLEDSLRRAEDLRRSSDDRPDLLFQANRAVATLVDLRASFSTPVFCAEIAVASPDPLPEIFLRDIGSCLTSENDVVRHQGHTVVAGQRLLLGGFDVERQPRGLPDALRAGLPLRGGMGDRTIADLITLSESPVRLPVPIGGPIPTVPSGTMRDLAVPPALRTGVAIGSGSGGRRVHLPWRSLDRHMFITGATGTGKSTVLCSCAVDDLRHNRPFLFVDVHGPAADRITAFADAYGIPAVVVDANDGNAHVLQLLPRLRANRKSLVSAESAATRVCDAVVASLPNKEWAGPRWLQTAKPLLLLAMAHGVDIATAISWFTNGDVLREKVKHPALPEHAATILMDLHSPRHTDGVGVRDWAMSKFDAFTSAAVRRIVAPAGKGRAIPELIASGVPIIVNLSALSSSEASLVGHLILSSILEAAMESPDAGRQTLRGYIDEAQRFVVASLQRIQNEGRKFKVSLALATQSSSQLDRVLADIAGSAAIQIAFRQTPDSANALAPTLGIPARELTDLPDLHAYVKVTGESTCSLEANPYGTCPPLRTKVPPRAVRARRSPVPRTPSARAVAKTLQVPTPEGPFQMPRPSPSTPGQPKTFLDTWLEKHRKSDGAGARPPGGAS